MKNILIISILTLLIVPSAFSQVELGMRLGASSAGLADLKPVSIIRGGDMFNISPADQDYGIHFGFYTRLSFLGVYIEPAIVLNSVRTDYRVDRFSEDGWTTEVLSERFNNIDMPLMIGTKLWFFRVSAGPVAHFYLDHTSELFSAVSYRENLSTATYGFAAGLGLDLWKFRLDLHYEGNLSAFGDDINIGGNTLALEDRPARMIASLGYRF